MSDFDWAIEENSSGSAWYRKYRPRTLDDYAGDSIKKKVRAIMRPENMSHVPHFWFIQGTHGCGKTTLARILTKYFLCENPSPDGEPCGKCEMCELLEHELIENGKSVDCVHEVNASEITTKEGLLQKLEEARRATFAKYNILILDEVQRASEGAQQALLKPLEDIPDDFIVLMATTEPSKVLSTIRSRAQIIINVGRHSAGDVAQRLADACDAEGYNYDKSALERIALREKGIFRESFNRLETLVSTLQNKNEKITTRVVDEAYNLLPDNTFITFLNNCRNCNIGGLVLAEDEIFGEGYSAYDFVAALSGFVSEGLSQVYGKASAGKKTKEFMLTLSDTQALRLVETLADCRDKLRNAGKFDEGLSMLEVAAQIYTKVFAPVQTGGGVSTVTPKTTEKAGESHLASGEETFHENLMSVGHGNITEDTDDDEDPY